MTTNNLIPTQVERVLHALHPGQLYEAPDLEVFDRHLRPEAMRMLLSRVADQNCLIAELEPALSEMDRSNHLHIGLCSLPSWSKFNRGLEGHARLAALRDHGGSIVYWNIDLSRVGPFWKGFWNRFTEHRGRVIPELSNEPSSSEWTEGVSSTRDVLASFNLRELPPDVLALPVHWLKTHMSAMLMQRGQSPHPTVENGLFTDLD